MNKADIEAYIDTYITTNGINAITGAVLADVLHQLLYMDIRTAGILTDGADSDADGTTAIRWAGGYRELYNNAGNKTVDWDGGKLFRSDSTYSVDWEASQLQIGGGDASIDWLVKKLYGMEIDYANGTLSGSAGVTVDYANGYLYNTGGIAVDWINGYIYDNGGGFSVDFFNHTLLSASGTTAVDYINMTLSDTGANLIVDWDNQIMNDSTGSTAITYSYASRALWDNGGNVSADYHDRVLVDASAAGSLSWQDRRLLNTGGAVVAHWGSIGGPNEGFEIATGAYFKVTDTYAGSTRSPVSQVADITTGFGDTTVGIMGRPNHWMPMWSGAAGGIFYVPMYQ